MAMTRKDYGLIASAINSALKNNANIIDVLADVFSTINPRFNGDKFVEACLKDWSPPPPKETALSDIVVGGVYEYKHHSTADAGWLKEGMHVRVEELCPSDPEYPVQVSSIDGGDEVDWIHHSQLGARVDVPDMVPLTPDGITLSARTGDLLWTIGDSADEEEEG